MALLLIRLPLRLFIPQHARRPDEPQSKPDAPCSSPSRALKYND
jgi:hypothetical protein